MSRAIGRGFVPQYRRNRHRLVGYCVVVLSLHILMSHSVLPVLATSLQVALPSRETWESGLTLALNKRTWVSSIAGINGSWDRQLTQIFHEADLNHDGSISFDECYERLLKFYIKLNQQAPIPPPDRQTVKELYTEYDWNHNHRLSCDEFKQLARLLARNAVTRLVAHKVVTLLVAPLVAATLVQALAEASLLSMVRSLLSRVLEALLPIHLAQTLQSLSFWRTVVMIVTVSQLGNTVLNVVNAWFYTKTTKKNSK
jgi:EF-hand domain pair